MVAYANDEAMSATLATGEAHFWSRSRRELWHKGGTSGNVQRVLRAAARLRPRHRAAAVEPAGPACHTGAVSCFRDEASGGAATRPAAGERERRRRRPPAPRRARRRAARRSCSSSRWPCASRASPGPAVQLRQPRREQVVPKAFHVAQGHLNPQFFFYPSFFFYLPARCTAGRAGLVAARPRRLAALELVRGRPRAVLPARPAALGGHGHGLGVSRLPAGPGRLRPPGRAARGAVPRGRAAARRLLAHGRDRRDRRRLLAARARAVQLAAAAGRRGRRRRRRRGGCSLVAASRPAPRRSLLARRARRRPRHVHQVQPGHARAAGDVAAVYASRGGGAARAPPAAAPALGWLRCSCCACTCRCSLPSSSRSPFMRARPAALPPRLPPPEPHHAPRLAGLRARRQRVLVQRHAQPDGALGVVLVVLGRRRARLGLLAAHAPRPHGRALRRRLLRLHRDLEGARRPLPAADRAAAHPARRRGSAWRPRPAPGRGHAASRCPPRPACSAVAFVAAAHGLDRVRPHAERPGTCAVARDWIQRNIPAGSLIAVETYGAAAGARGASSGTTGSAAWSRSPTASAPQAAGAGQARAHARAGTLAPTRACSTWSPAHASTTG